MSDPEAVSTMTASLRMARKVVVAVIGGTIVVIGLALVVLPGPAFVVIPLGIALLATEFLWARRLLVRVKAGVTRWFGRRPAGQFASRPPRDAVVRTRD